MLTRENEGSKKSVRKVVQDFVHQQYCGGQFLRSWEIHAYSGAVCYLGRLDRSDLPFDGSEALAGGILLRCLVGDFNWPPQFGDCCLAALAGVSISTTTCFRFYDRWRRYWGTPRLRLWKMLWKMQLPQQRRSVKN